jgi:spore coat protein U-like protein
VGDSNQSQPVYGKIPAGQNTLRAGSFSDSLTMTLTYNP